MIRQVDRYGQKEDSVAPLRAGIRSNAVKAD